MTAVDDFLDLPDCRDIQGEGCSGAPGMKARIVYECVRATLQIHTSHRRPNPGRTHDQGNHLVPGRQRLQGEETNAGPTFRGGVGFGFRVRGLGIVVGLGFRGKALNAATFL